MPKQTSSQETGRIGERWFDSQLPPNWIAQFPREDVGIDRVVVICEPGSANGLEFRVQVKSSVRFQRRNDKLVVRGVKRSAVKYWVTGFTPTLVVAYETSLGMGYCAWANQILASKTELLQDAVGVCSLCIPTNMPVDESLWGRIRDQVGGISAALGRRLLLAGRVVPFLRALNQMSGALQGLYFAEAARPPEPNRTEAQREFMWELEVTCHRDVVRATLALEKEVLDCSVTIGGLKQYAEEYARRCRGFIPEFDRTITTEAKPCQCRVDPEGLANERRPLMNSIAGAIHELTHAAVRASRTQHAE